MKTRADVNARLDALLAKARAAPPMTEEEKRDQMRSWVRGEMVFGSDADERAWRDAHTASKEE